MRALVVDDEAPARRRLADLLETLGVEVLGEAANGLEALDLARTRRPDVIFLDVSMPEDDPSRDIFLDGALCRDALIGMLQSLLALAPRAGVALSVKAQMTSIRPALIVECVLLDSEPDLGPEAFSRFFDARWREHPCGPNAGAALAAFASVARAHGGRVDAKPAGNGCQVTFVVPRIDG